MNLSLAHPDNRRAYLVLILLLIAACYGGPDRQDTEEADILAAVQIYLREERGLNPDAMQAQITELSFDGDKARAMVRFSSADMPQGMQFEYTLERTEGQWTVIRSAGQGGHGGGGEFPEGHPEVSPDSAAPEAAPVETNSG